jgi:hypothetical protein
MSIFELISAVRVKSQDDDRDGKDRHPRDGRGLLRWQRDYLAELEKELKHSFGRAKTDNK